MKNKTIVLSIFLMLVISTMAVNAISLKKNNINEISENKVTFLEDNGPEAELPVWSIGDSWNYYGSIKGKQGTSISFDIDFDNMLLEVTSINPINYTLDISVPEGDLTGFGSVSIENLPKVSGNIKDASINGFFIINKTDLAIDKSEVQMEGTVDAIIDVDFTADLSTYFVSTDTFDKMFYKTVEFPIFLNDTWTREEANIVTDLNVNLISNPTTIYLRTTETLFNCMGWDIVDVSGEDFDALKINRNSEENFIWYSPRAGNIIKVDFRDIDMGFGYKLDRFTTNLKSTTFSVSTNSPEIPTTPTGPTTADVGKKVEYSTITTDPDGDKIRYVFDFSDGTTISSDVVESGVEASVEKTWIEKGTFDVKVKARDIYGGESDWSDVLSVEVINDPPEKPLTPNGPKNGKGGIFGNTYTYKTSSNDPNLHRIRYGWDWNGDMIVDYWTSFFESGEDASGSYKWTDKGNYEIRVIAEDEFGSESEWSDPLVVSMPKIKNINLERFQILHRFIQKFPILSEKLSNLL